MPAFFGEAVQSLNGRRRCNRSPTWFLPTNHSWKKVVFFTSHKCHKYFYFRIMASSLSIIAFTNVAHSILLRDHIVSRKATSTIFKEEQVDVVAWFLIFLIHFDTTAKNTKKLVLYNGGAKFVTIVFCVQNTLSVCSLTMALFTLSSTTPTN